MTKWVSRVGAMYFIVGYLVGFLLYLVSDSLFATHYSSSDRSQYVITRNDESSEPTEIEAMDMDQDDRLYHRDDISQAEKLADDIRVLCWVMTSRATLRRKNAALLLTWAKRCSKMIFISEIPDPNFIEPLIVLNAEPKKDRTMTAFDYIYKHHVDDADWFLNVDDSTYVIVENLRYLLASWDSALPLYFRGRETPEGQRYVKTSYIISKKALQLFGERHTGECVEDRRQGQAVAKCLDALGVRSADSRDVLGRRRMHYIPHGSPKQRKYFLPSREHGEEQGITSMSDYSVSFHNLPLRRMEEFEYLVYHLRVYGIIPGFQRLNDRSIDRKQ